MLILPDRNIPRSKILLPVAPALWRTPSRAQPKDEFGNENKTRFRLRARLNDGHVIWRGWFDDREDFDEFIFALFSGSLGLQRELWRLPTPAWHPDLNEGAFYDFATVTVLNSSGSNLTYNRPPDWNDSNNFVELLGGGGGGATSTGTGTRVGLGGGAGQYAKTTNFVFTGGSATYYVAVSAAPTQGFANGGDATYFDGIDFASATISAGAGNGGVPSTTSANSGAAGGTGGVGGLLRDGATGGPTSGSATGKIGTGGGGAPGPNGAGNPGGSVTVANTASAGGSGDAGSGGSAGTAGGTAGGNGGAGSSEWGGSGPGGGGGGGLNTGGAATAGNGGNYGAGGGGYGSSTGTNNGGGGAQGVIVTTYTPFGLPFLNSSEIMRRAPQEGRSFSSGFNPNLYGTPPAKPPLRRPDDLPIPPFRMPQSWTAFYNLNLIGQDTLPVLQKDWPLPVPPYRIPQSWAAASPFWAVRPFSQNDWPLPIPPYRAQQSITVSYNLNLVGQDNIPPGRQYAEPMRGYFYAPDLRTTALNLSLLLQRPPIAQYDWPLPVPPYRVPQSWVNPSAPFWLNKPFLQTDWPLPTAPWRSPSLSTWVDPLKLNLIGQDAMAPGRQATELALGVPLTSWIRTWTWYSLPIVPPNPFPFNQYDWPLPTQQRPGVQLRTWTNSYLLTLIGQDRMAAGARIYDLARGAPPPVPSWVNPSAPFWLNKPFLQTDWPLPVPQWRMPQSWAASYNLNLIGQDKLPFRQTDWPLPGRQPLFLAAPYLFPIGLAPVAGQPFAQYDWPLPARPPYFNAAPTLVPPSLLILSPRPFAQYDWPIPFQASLFRQAPIASSPFFLVKPFAQYDWPVPIGRTDFRPASASGTITFLAAAGRPFSQTDWPLPQAPQYPASLRTATGDNAAQLQSVTMPQGKASYDLTGRPPHPISLRGYTLSLGAPAFLASVPFRQTDWPLPTQQRPSIQLRTWIDPVKLNLLGKDTRFFVYDRPLPRRQPDPNFSYAYSRFPGLIPTSFAVCAHSEVTAFESTTRVSSATSQTEVVGPLTSNTKFASC